MKNIIGVIILSAVFFIPHPVLAAVESTLKCSPATGNFKVGDTISIDYIMDSKTNDAFGATVVAMFDPSLIASSANLSEAVTSVTNWTQPLTNTIDNTLGKITLDYGNNQSAYNGSTPIGKGTFTALAPGQAQVIFTFFQQFDDTTPGVSFVFGKRDGTTITNILTDVNNCIYVIEGATPTPTIPGPSPTIGAAPTVTTTAPPLVQELPRTGSIETLLGFLGMGGFFIFSGSLFYRNLKKTEKA